MSASTLKQQLLPLLKLAIPLCVTGLFQSAVFFFETLFLAHLGEKTLAAGALVSWLCGTLAVISFGILSSINIVIAHQYGAKDQKAISQSLRDGFLLALALTIPTILLYWNTSPIFLLFGQSPEIVTLSTAYLHALAYGVLPNFLIIALLEFIMGIGHTSIIMKYTLGSVSLNIALSYLLIFGKAGFPALGIAGAGWGMTLSFWVSAFIMFIYVLTHEKYRPYFKDLRWLAKPLYLREMFNLGLPMGLMYCVEVGFFFALTLCMGSLGTLELAANQLVMQYLGLFMSSIFTVAQAVTVRMGHLLGQKEVALASEANRLGMLVAGGYMLVVAILYLYFPEQLIGLDLNSSMPQTAAITALAKKLFFIAAIFQFFEAMRISLFGGLRGLKETRFTLLTSILSFWCVALPLGYWLSTLGFDAQGFWWAMVVSAIFSFALLYRRFKVRIRRYRLGMAT